MKLYSNKKAFRSVAPPDIRKSTKEIAHALAGIQSYEQEQPPMSKQSLQRTALHKYNNYTNLQDYHQNLLNLPKNSTTISMSSRLDKRFRPNASRAEETRSKSIISMNHMENVKKSTQFSRKSLPGKRFLQSRDSSVEKDTIMPRIHKTRPITKDYGRKNHTAMSTYADAFPILKKDDTLSQGQDNVEDAEVEMINFSVPLSPVVQKERNIEDMTDYQMSMPPLVETASNINTTSSSKKPKSHKSRVQEAYELEQMIKSFNSTRIETQFQKIKKIVEQNPMLGKSMDFNKFIQSIVQRKGILGVSTEDPKITKINQQIIMQEEIFENRRNLDISRPRIKDHVLGKLRNGLAGPAFLIQLKSDTRDIDKYLAKYKNRKEAGPRKVKDFHFSQSVMTNFSANKSTAENSKNRKVFNSTASKLRDIMNFDKEFNSTQDNSDLFASTTMMGQNNSIMTNTVSNNDAYRNNHTTSRGPTAFQTLSTFRGSSVGSRPFSITDDIPKPSPFLPAHLKHMELPRSTAQPTMESKQEEELIVPNFLKSMFTILEGDEEYLASQYNMDEIVKVFNRYYNITDESELDKNNQYLNFVIRAKENQAKASKQSLTTVSACSQAINQVLISQHQVWVQKMHEKYLKQQKKEVVTETVFDRIKLDELYRQQKHNFLNYIEKQSQNEGKGFVFSKYQSIQQVDGELDETRINMYDVDKYLRDGGKIKDLIDPITFNNLYKNTIKEIDAKNNIDAKMEKIIAKKAFNLMLRQLITLQNQRQKLKVKNTLSQDGTREGQPTSQLQNELAIKEAKKKFRREIFASKNPSESKPPEYPDSVKFKSHKNECFYPLDTFGRMHPTVEAELLSVKKISKDKWFEAQLNQLQKEIDLYYQQHEYLYQDVKQQ